MRAKCGRENFSTVVDKFSRKSDFLSKKAWGKMLKNRREMMSEM